MGANRTIILIVIALIAVVVYNPVSAKEVIVGSGSEANFSSIQEAVNNSSPGDVILVLPGIYNETVDVTVESLSILSESENPEDTIVTVFHVRANSVTVSGFSITGGMSGDDCLNCIFSDNMFLGSSLGLYSGREVTNATIVNNTIQGGFIGLGGSDGNRIVNNTISNTISETEDSYGIAFFEASSNYVANNHISDGKYGISMARLSDNNEIVSNTLISNYVGVSVTDVSRGNNITGNAIINNSIGIRYEYSWNNLVTGNNVSLNKKYGVYLNLVSYEAPYTGTTLFCNNIFNNKINVFNDTSNYYTADAISSGAGITPILWNVTKTPGTSIVGGSYLGGNYWAKPEGTGFSQVCVDSNGDGICDSPYNITENDSDYLPLTTSPAQRIDGKFILTEVRITTNESGQYMPAIYGDRIAWQDGRNENENKNYDIYMYDLSALRETQIVTNESWQNSPAIYDNRIVWVDNRSGNWDIYMCNLSTSKETQITTNKSNQFNPVIYGDRIVWSDERNGPDNTDIYMYDLLTSKETQITNSVLRQLGVAVYGDRILCAANHEYPDIESTDIYVYNLSRPGEIQIVTNKSTYGSAIYGDRIVWADNRNGNADIYMYNLSTSKETQITTNGSDQMYPAIYGDRIVWQDRRNGNDDIYMYDISTSREIQITTNESIQQIPVIYRDRIVWQDGRNGHNDIYMCIISSKEESEHEQLIADFSANVTSGYAPLKVLFTDNSAGSPTSWLWDFGDGIHSKHSMNAAHTFTKPGKYNISLTVSNANGSNTTAKPGFITVKSLEAPVADFSANVTSGNAPLKILFMDNSTGSPTSWYWDFGDGINSKHAMNAAHTFASPGTYNVTLTVTNAAGNSSVTKPGYITVTSPSSAVKPVAGFYSPEAEKVRNGINDQGIFENEVISFYDNSTGSPTSWFWDFGDGNTSTQKNPTHAYGKIGGYTVNLTVKNANGSDTISKYGYVLMGIKDEPATTAYFSADVTSGKAPLTVTFVDDLDAQLPNYPIWREWDFGDGVVQTYVVDGNDSATPYATHTYEKPGKYTVTLSMDNRGGKAIITKYNYVTVTVADTVPDMPMADFSANLTSGNAPLVVKFIDTGTGGTPTSWLWDFGDGTYSKHAMNAAHTFTRPGVYDITLTVTNSAGKDTMKKSGYISVTGLKAPAADFSANVTSGKVPLVVKFNDMSSGSPTAWYWDFGDGIYSKHAMNATHTYTRAGVYDVALTVKNDTGSNTTEKTGYITVQDASFLNDSG